MKSHALFVIISAGILSCSPSIEKQQPDRDKPIPITGTWKLISGTLIENGDTTITFYTEGVSFIKIINADHFAFLQHDLQKGNDSNKVFSAGGGKYDLNDSSYTEHLEYCTAREWEGNSFNFTVSLINDTLIQKGIEKIESQNINRLNIEKYVRLKD